MPSQSKFSCLRGGATRAIRERESCFVRGCASCGRCLEPLAPFPSWLFENSSLAWPNGAVYKYSWIGPHNPPNLWPVRTSVRADQHLVVFHLSFRTNMGAILKDVLAPKVVAVLKVVHGPGGMASSQGIPLGGASPSPLCILIHSHDNLHMIL